MRLGLPVFLPGSSTGRGSFTSLIEILQLLMTGITRHTTTVTDPRPAVQPVSVGRSSSTPRVAVRLKHRRLPDEPVVLVHGAARRIADRARSRRP
jgi:hypothetical protein